MKKLVAVTTAALLAIGLAGVGAPPASATEECVAQDAWAETITETVPGISAVEEVSHVEHEFEHAPNGKYKTRWVSDSNWNANGNANSTGWRSTGETRIVVTVPGVDAVETVPAVIVEHDAIVCEVEPPVVDAPVVEPPVVEPPVVTPPVVTPPVVTPPAVTPVVDTPTSVTPTDSLANTGATADGGLIAGTVLFGLGVLAMIGAAYRRAHTE